MITITMKCVRSRKRGGPPKFSENHHSHNPQIHLSRRVVRCQLFHDAKCRSRLRRSKPMFRLQDTNHPTTPSNDPKKPPPTKQNPHTNQNPTANSSPSQPISKAHGFNSTHGALPQSTLRISSKLPSLHSISIANAPLKHRSSSSE